MRLFRLVLLIALIARLAALAVAGPLPQSPTDVNRGLDPRNIDRAYKPCDDFYMFAVGGWLASHPLPRGGSQMSQLGLITLKTRDVLHRILEENALPASHRNGNERLIGDFYASGMDTTTIQKLGLRPLKPYLDRIDAIRDLAGMQDVLAKSHQDGVSALFDFGAETDLRDSKRVIAGAGQGGLGMPERDYYLKTDNRSVTVRKAYARHIATMLQLAGISKAQAEADARSVIEIETALAKASDDRERARDPAGKYHLMTVAEMSSLTPHFSWPRYFAAVGAPPIARVNVSEPAFFKAMDGLLASVPIDGWKAYLRYHLLDDMSDALPSAFVEEDFNFGGRVVAGRQIPPARWEKMVRLTDAFLGDALGQLFVRRTMTPAARQRALDMVHNIEAALREDLQKVPWMGESTRREALAKLNAVVERIGFPDQWRDYSELHMSRTEFLENCVAIERFRHARQMRKIGQAADRSEWRTTPSTVNAYYSPQSNEIVFPAAILQPPVFNPEADDAVNYGAAGAIIGHELTHGFDDVGSQFDAGGNLRNWWAPQDLAQFKTRTALLEKQMSSYVVLPGLKMNGKLVLGESLADLGGLSIAYAAFERSMAGKPRPPDIDGFSPEQRFFLSWAQVWAANDSADFIRYALSVDNHPVSRFRVNAPLSNMPAFFKAFGCPAGCKMMRPERVEVW